MQMQEPMRAPEPDPPASETTRPSSGTTTRLYVVLIETTDPDSDQRQWTEVARRDFRTAEEAFEAIADERPRAGDDHAPRTYVVVPATHFKAKTEKVERIERRVWS